MPGIIIDACISERSKHNASIIGNNLLGCKLTIYSNKTITPTECLQVNNVLSIVRSNRQQTTFTH